MNIAFFNASTALQAFQRKVENVSHNVANVNTPGFKSQHVRFESALYSQLDVNSEAQLMRGHGVVTTSTTSDFTQGAVQTTHQVLDFALMGPGFFAKETPDGLVYTRNGAFRLGESENQNYLVDVQGAFVLDEQLQRIAVNFDDPNLAIASIKDRLGIFQFDNVQNLAVSENNGFVAQVNNRRFIDNQGSTMLIQGALEMSNMNLTDGMVALINGQRSIQVNARVIQTADQLEEIINNLR